MDNPTWLAALTTLSFQARDKKRQTRNVEDERDKSLRSGGDGGT
jgi:hypothetical protein